MKSLYNRLRPKLPRKHAEYNGVDVRTYRWSKPRRRPDFEQTTIAALKEHIQDGDHVVVVGGGHGVCSTIAAREGATVTCIEAADAHVDITRETLELNDVTDRVTVTHGLVGPAVDVWGDYSDAQRISPEQLPECDVLLLDCEGAELQILTKMDKCPADTVVVEVHEGLGCPETRVVDALQDCGLKVTNRQGDAPTPILTAEADP